jgi:hypothetical protein
MADEWRRRSGWPSPGSWNEHAARGAEAAGAFFWSVDQAEEKKAA